MTMVALGGSITAGQGVSVAEDGYIARLYHWVKVSCLLAPSDRSPLPSLSNTPQCIISGTASMPRTGLLWRSH